MRDVAIWLTHPGGTPCVHRVVGSQIFEKLHHVLELPPLLVGTKVSTRTRPHYDLAVARLEAADSRDWVFDSETRERALEEEEEEEERALWMARVEALMGLLG